MAGVGIDRGGGLLHGVGHAVELRRVAAIPERMEGRRLAGGVIGHERLRDDDEGAARAGEAGRLRKAAKLDRHVAGTFDLVD